jgi:hypothetical protein
MANDQTSIHQFRALAAIEQAFRDDPSLAGPALERMGSPLDLDRPTVLGVEAGTRDLGGEDPFDHFNAHWLSGSYFPGVDRDTLLATLIDGFRAAVEVAQKTGKQLVPVWVRGTDDAKSADFRVDHVETPTSVVVAIITPKPQR